MPLLQPVTKHEGVEVPKPLCINKRATPTSSSSSSTSSATPYRYRRNARSKARPALDLHNLEYPEPLRIRPRSTSTTPSPSPQPRPRGLQPTLPLPTNTRSIPASIPLGSTPNQHRRLEISPLPRRPRLTPPSRESPVDSAYQRSTPTTPQTPALRINRRNTYYTTSVPATPTNPPGNHVLVTTGDTYPFTRSPSQYLSIPALDTQDEEDPSTQDEDTPNPDAILPAPLTQILTNRSDIVSIPPPPPSSPKKYRTEIKRKLTMTRRSLFRILSWNPDPTLTKDLQVIDEKLKTTAQAVVRSGEKWKRCAAFLPKRSDFDGFERMTRVALNRALETHGYPGRRICERGVGEEEDGEEEEEEVVEVRDTIGEEHAALRELVERSLSSRGWVIRMR